MLKGLSTTNAGIFIALGSSAGILAVLHPLLVLGLAGLFLAVFITIQVFRDPFFGVLCIAFFLPFERIGAIEAGGITIRIHQIIALQTILSWIIQSVFSRRLRLRRHKAVWPALFFWLTMLGSLLSASNSLRGILVYGFIVFTMLTGWIVFQLVDTRERVVQVFRVLAISAALVSLFGVFQWVGDQLGLPASITGIQWRYHKDVLGVARLQATTLEPLYFANYLMIVLPAVMSLLLINGKSADIFRGLKRAVWILVGITVVLWSALVLTASRGGLAGMLLAVFVIVIFRSREVVRQRVLLLAVGGGVLIALVTILSLGGSAEQSARFFLGQSTQVMQTSADQERIDSFKTAYTNIGLRPWLGHGPGQYGVLVSGETRGASDEGWDIVNNEYLELLYETGLIGSFLLLALLGLWIIEGFRTLYRKQDSVISALLLGTLAGLIGILLQYMTFSTLYIMHVWFLIGYGAALQKLPCEQEISTNIPKEETQP